MAESEKEFKCTYCTKVLSSQSWLTRHLKTEHPVEFAAIVANIKAQMETEPPSVDEPFEEDVSEPDPTPELPKPQKKKRGKKMLMGTPLMRKMLLDTKKGIVKKNHAKWRKHPELAPLGWEDNKVGE